MQIDQYFSQLNLYATQKWYFYLEVFPYLHYSKLNLDHRNFGWYIGGVFLYFSSVLVSCLHASAFSLTMPLHHMIIVWPMTTRGLAVLMSDFSFLILLSFGTPPSHVFPNDYGLSLLDEGANSSFPQKLIDVSSFSSFQIFFYDLTEDFRLWSLKKIKR